MQAAANTIASEAQHGAGHTHYRPDIDGLRSIAVLGVVLYHFGIPGFSGGYVGVDVFFVISGFLIGRSIISDMKARSFSLPGFYERRIRRLYPAFMFVVAVSIPIFHWLLLPSDLRSFGRSLVAALFYVSNIAFYREHGYFDAGAINKPLLHTWSLSVEEQFYVFFPLLVWLTVRWRASALPLVVAILGVASFGAAQWRLSGDETAVFYLFPYRAWELMLGVGLTLLLDREPPSWLERSRTMVALAGLVLIVGPIVLYDHDTPFPALAAAPPCLGAALLIMAGTRGSNPASQLLATPLPVFVGLISYSFYLWHWPILVALTYYFSGSLSPALAAIGVAASIAGATFSWRYIERPPRRKGFLGRWQLFGIAALLSLLLATIGLHYYRTDGLPSRFQGPNAALVEAAQDFHQYGGRCVDADKSPVAGLAYCLLGAPDVEPTFLVWGDSHARAFHDGIDLAAREAGKAGLLVWSGGCPTLFDVGKSERTSSAAENSLCRAQNDNVRQFLDRDVAIRNILLVGRWAYYSEGSGIGRDAVNRVRLSDADHAPATAAEQEQFFAAHFTDTVEWLKASGRSVFVLEQTPEIPQSNAPAIAQAVISGRLSPDQARRRYALVARSAVEQRQSSAQSLFRRLAEQGTIAVLPTHDLFCTQWLCTSWFEGAPALFDNNHVTVTTARRIRGIFLPAFQPAPAKSAGTP